MGMLDYLTNLVSVRKNSTGSDFVRPRLNLIEGTGVTLTVADDLANDETDITVANSGLVNVRKNSTGSVYTRPQINFIEGSNVTLTVADDGAEVDVTVAATQVTAPSCRVEMTGGTSIGVNSATLHTVSWNIEVFDTDTMWAIGTPTKMFATQAGKYLINASVAWGHNGSTAGNRYMFINFNGSTVDIASDVRIDTGDNYVQLNTSALWNFTAGQYIELKVYQNSGVLNNFYAEGVTQTTTGSKTCLSMVRVSA